MEAWTPEAKQLLCACGCGERVTFQGIGRKRLYVSDAHRKRAARRRSAAQQ